MQAVKPDCSVELCDAAPHRTSILELWRRGYGWSNVDRFDWVYSKSLGQSVCALMRNEDGRIVGMNGLRLRRVWIDGDEHLLGQAIDLVVEPAYRTAGPAIRLQRELIGEATRVGIAALYGCPGPSTATAVVRRIGYRALGKRERWLHILKADFVLVKARIKHEFLRQLLALPFNLTLNLWSLRPARSNRWKTEILQSFDERFDSLWNRARSNFQVVGERSSLYLYWRFGEVPWEKSRIIAVSDQKGELQAYAIYTIQDHTALIRDMLFADEQSLDRLLSETLRHARRTGLWAVSFTFFGARLVSAALKRRGFFRRPEQSHIVLQCLGIVPETNWEQWYFTDADRDV